MSVEPRRGCGFRKIGGLYFVGGGRPVFCDRLPIPLEICPVCKHGIKQTRGFTWVHVEELVGGLHRDCKDDFPCPLCMTPDTLGLAGLLWIGERFYKTVEDFIREANTIGISRRISAIPRGFKVGETWILFAHPKTIPTPLNCSVCGLLMTARLPEKVIAEKTLTTAAVVERALELYCSKCDKAVRAYRPGIFRVWKPERIEKILPESARGSAETRELLEKGITPVFVPDDDPDHRGTVYDKENGEED